MESPQDRLTRILRENNLTIQQTRLNPRLLPDGGFVMDMPNVVPVFTDPTKEGHDQVRKETINESTN